MITFSFPLVDLNMMQQLFFLNYDEASSWSTWHLIEDTATYTFTENVDIIMIIH